jgi:hypothetical protein
MLVYYQLRREAIEWAMQVGLDWRLSRF